MRTIHRGGLALAACSILAAGLAGESGADTDHPAAGPRATAAAVDRLTQATRAVRTAQRAVRDGTAYDIESDRRAGRRVWEVKVARGTARPYEFDVSADGHTIVHRGRRARLDDDARKAARARTTLAAALRTAGRRVGSGTFDEAEIDRWRGRVVWEATFEQPGDRETEVRIDASNGKVLAVTVDD